MTVEDAYNAAKGVYRTYGEFYKAVAEQVGVERALDLCAKPSEASGRAFAETLKDADSKEFAAEFKEYFAAMGYSTEIDECPGKVVLTAHRCPRYDGFRAAGLDHEQIESMCLRSFYAEDAAITNLLPNVRSSLKFRSASDDSCVQEIVLG